MHRERMRSCSTGRSRSERRKYYGHRLTAKAENSEILMVLCKDGHWHPFDGHHRDAQLFKHQLAADTFAKELHEAGRMLHWTFTAQEVSRAI